MDITTWWDCYNDQWGDELVPEAFSHPAKGAPGLSKRIYDHAFEEGWLSAGGMVLDPFGGIAGFGLQAMAHGLAWVGVELEPKFVDLGNQNIALWNRRYSRFTSWGSAVLLQGDSRNLLAVVETSRVAGVVASPPFGEEIKGGMPDSLLTHTDGRSASRKLRGLSSGNGQLGNSPGQLGSMPAGDFDATVSSPPYENSNLTIDTDFMAKVERDKRNGSRLQPGLGEYGNTEGQIGASSGDDFWSAARIIVQQTYATLRPGGHAIWVVKAFVRNKAIVDFPGQWRRLCETCGFVTLHEHHAMLRVEQAQLLLDGGHTRKARVSFFRRNHESKAMAAKFWLTLTREVKADCLRRAHAMAWKVYQKSESGKLPSKNKIILAAKMFAWKDRGKPEIDVPVRIDFEVVLCQVKPMTLAEGRELAIEALEQAEVRRQDEREREAAWFADCAVNSPPFQGAHGGTTDTDSMLPPHDSTGNVPIGYGHTPGQLGNMKVKS